MIPYTYTAITDIYRSHSLKYQREIQTIVFYSLIRQRFYIVTIMIEKQLRAVKACTQEKSSGTHTCPNPLPHKKQELEASQIRVYSGMQS